MTRYTPSEGGAPVTRHDDMLFLNDWPNYEEEWDRGVTQGLKGVVRND